MPSTRSVAIVVLAVAIISGAWWVTFARPIVFCAFWQNDSIDAAGCGTYYVLENYDGQPEKAVSWLLAYHGDAPSHQVMMSLLGWAYDHPDSFIDMLSRIGDEDEHAFIRRFAWAITDTVQSDHFNQAFASRAHESERLLRILEQVEEMQRSSARHE